MKETKVRMLYIHLHTRNLVRWQLIIETVQRLYNQCCIHISQTTFHGPRDSSDGNISVIWDQRTNKTEALAKGYSEVKFYINTNMNYNSDSRFRFYIVNYGHHLFNPPSDSLWLDLLYYKGVTLYHCKYTSQHSNYTLVCVYTMCKGRLALSRNPWPLPLTRHITWMPLIWKPIKQ